MIFLDTETTGLDPRADRLVLVGIAGRDGEVLVLEHDQDRDLIQRVLEAETLFVGHNVGFDMAFLEHAGYRIPPPSRWQDTQLVAHVAGERKPGMLQLRRLQQKLIEEGLLQEEVARARGRDQAVAAARTPRGEEAGPARGPSSATRRRTCSSPT